MQTEAPEPVVAELVESAAQPRFSFGLRAMLIVMGICSVQFAVMNWVGVFVGLLATSTICILMFAGVFAFALVSARGGRRTDRRLDQISIRLVIAISIVTLAAFATGYAIPIIHMTKAAIVRARVQADLGIDAREIVVRDNDDFVAGLEIRHVRPGSIADQAGLRVDDVILPPRTCAEWFQQIDARRGKPIVINGATGAASQPVEKCRQFGVQLTIPD